MEAQPDARCMWVCRAQQFHRQRRRRAELARQIQHRRPLRHGKADDQAKLAGDTGRGRLVQDLRKLLGAVEHEVAHGVPLPRLADGAARLHRVHEMDRGLGEHLTHQRDLADRRAVEMRYAAGVDGTQHRRLRVGLHRVEHVARKYLGKIARGRLDRRRPQTVHRLLRPLHSDQFVDRRQWRCGAEKAAAQRRHGRADAQVVHAENPRRQGHKGCRRAISPRRQTQTVLRGLRIAANRSANIGDSLTTPAPRLDRPDEKDALRRCCAPDVFTRGSRHVRCVRRRSTRRSSGELHIGTATVGEACDDQWCGNCCCHISADPRTRAAPGIPTPRSPPRAR